MRKIIEGKIYDTEKAEYLCGESFGSSSDLGSTFFHIYLSKKGQFFTHEGGGPMSKYSVSVGQNNTAGSETMKMLEDDEAKRLIAKMDVEKALLLFPQDFLEG